MSVALAVITFRRPAQLARLLASLQQQEPVGAVAWDARIIVVDNDPAGSAREVTTRCRGRWPVEYATESAPGIPAARRASLALSADADAVVFVDDDEVAPHGWLNRLVATAIATGAGVVTGPVHGLLPPAAPGWARRSDMFDSRGRHRSGARLTTAYTNNTLVRSQVIADVTPEFAEAFRFTGSSDLHFFRQLARAGVTILWDDDAVIQEHVPMERVAPGWFLRRAFRSGAGDSVSRALLDPWWRAAPMSAAIGLARMANGVALLCAGIVSPARAVTGARRLVSGIGTLAGIAGVNHAEYRRDRTSTTSQPDEKN